MSIFNIFLYLCFTIIQISPVKTLQSDYELIKLPQNEGGRCLDGSSPSIYFKKGDPKKFIFYFQGGNWCISDLQNYENEYENLKQCYKVSQGLYGSSKNLQQNIQFDYDILSDSQDNNPFFYDYTVVHLNYCDGTNYQGFVNDEVKGHENKRSIWFRGQANTLTAFKYSLEKLQMNKAEQILVTGGYGAGGIGTLNWIDYFQNYISQNINSQLVNQIKLKALVHDTLYLNAVNIISQDKSFGKSLKNNFYLSFQEENSIQNSCLQTQKSGEKWRCQFFYVMIRYIKTEILYSGNILGETQRQNILGLVCQFDQIFLNTCLPEEQLYINQYGQQMLEIFHSSNNISFYLTLKDKDLQFFGKNSFGEKIHQFFQQGKEIREIKFEQNFDQKLKQHEQNIKKFQRKKQEINVSKEYYLMLLNNERLGGKCLDGTPPSIYLKKGDPKKILIFFEGGGWCTYESKSLNRSYEGCLERAKNQRRGTSSQNDEKLEKYGILDPDSDKNPDYYDYTTIFINYCDGLGHQGYQKDPHVFENGEKIYIRGYFNTIGIIEYAMNVLNMHFAETVLVSGESAGGQAVITWIDYISERVKRFNQKATVIGLSDSGIFLDYPNMYTGKYGYSQRIQNVYKIANRQANIVNPRCHDYYNENERWRCMLGQYQIQHVKSPLLISQSQYDVWSINHVIHAQCHSFQVYNDCSEVEKQQIDMYRETFINEMNRIRTLKSNFAQIQIGCPHHGLLKFDKIFNSNNWAIPSGSYNTINYIVNEMVNDKQGYYNGSYVDEEESWPVNNNCCNNLYNTYLLVVLASCTVIVLVLIFIGYKVKKYKQAKAKKIKYAEMEEEDYNTNNSSNNNEQKQQKQHINIELRHRNTNDKEQNSNIQQMQQEIQQDSP